MKRSVYPVVIAVAVVLLLGGVCIAAPSYLGFSGSIVTPDDSVLGQAGFAAEFHQVDVHNSAQDFGIDFGITPTLEISASRFDPDTAGVSNKTVFNAKYLALPEQSDVPSITVGINDIGTQLDPGGSTGLFILVGKTLTSQATSFTAQPVNPLKVYLGYGGGIYDSSIFAGVNFALGSKVNLIGEYLNKLQMVGGLSDNNVVNFDARFGVAQGFSADVGLINCKDLGFGVSFNHSL